MFLGECEGQAHPRTDHLALLVKTIFKFDRAAVIFHDLLDNRQAKPRAFLACGYIGFSQTFAIVCRQAAATIGNFDHRVTIVAAGQ